MEDTHDTTQSPGDQSDTAEFHDYGADLIEAQTEGVVDTEPEPPLPDSQTAEALPDPSEEPILYLKQVEEFAPAQKQAALAHLKALRMAMGASRTVWNARVASGILESINDGHAEIATALLTPSTGEVLNLKRGAKFYNTLGSGSLGAEDCQRVLAEALEIHEAKVANFRAAIQDCGIAPALLPELLPNIEEHDDPESALKISPEFWHRFEGLPATARAGFMQSRRHPWGVSADCMDVLARNNLAEFAGELIEPMGFLQDDGGRAAYADSMSRALSTIEDSSDAKTWLGLEKFRDPTLALEFCRELYGNTDPQSIVCLADLFQSGIYASSLREITPEVANLLIEARALLIPMGVGEVNDTSLRRILSDFNDHHFTPERVVAVFEMLGAIKDLKVDGSKIVMGVLAAPELQASLSELAACESRVSKLPPAVQTEFLLNLLDMPEKAQRFLDMFASLQKQGVELVPAYQDRAGLGQMNAWDIRMLVEGELDEGGTQSGDALRMFIVEKRTEVEHRYSPYGRKLTPLGFYPEFRSELLNLVPGEIAEKMFAAWMSFEGDEGTKGRDEAVREEVNRLLDQLGAVKKYVDMYGQQEALAVHRTFGILNFSRIPCQNLHDQLNRWQNSTEPPTTVGVVSTRSYNHAFERVGDHFFETFGETGSFLFEADSKVELSRHLVSVGDRDRDQGRDPCQRPTVETLVISGHGGPTSIEMGYESIEVSDYVATRTSRASIGARANTYRRHLGDSYRVILDSCATGSESGWGQVNIAETVYDDHGHMVQAATDSITGYEKGASGVVFRGKGNERVQHRMYGKATHEDVLDTR